MTGYSEGPLITAGLTTYNARDTVSAALGSIRLQDYPSLEIVVVDDGSTDGTDEIVLRESQCDPRVRFIRQRNGGPAVARNSILAASTGQYVAFFDDDDVSLPQRVTTQYQRLRQYEAEHPVVPVACFASGSRRYPNGYEMLADAIGSRQSVPTGRSVANYLLFNQRLPGLFYGAGVPACALMASVETLKRVGGFDPVFRRVEDVDLAVRLALEGAHFIGCPERLYVQTASTGADKTAERNLEAELMLVERHAHYLRSVGRYHYARDWTRIRYLHFARQRARFLGALLLFLGRHPVSGMRHLLRSAPGRLRHEHRMAR